MAFCLTKSPNKGKSKNYILRDISDFVEMSVSVYNNNIQGKRCWFIVNHIKQNSFKGLFFCETPLQPFKTLLYNSMLLNFVYTLAQKLMLISKRNFICRFFMLKLRADQILVEIEPKIKGMGS